jgi:hypothetical protein
MPRGHHAAYHLVTGHDAGAPARQVAVDDVQVGAADPAGQHLEEHLMLAGLRHGQFHRGKRLAWPGYSHCQHDTAPS